MKRALSSSERVASFPNSGSVPKSCLQSSQSVSAEGLHSALKKELKENLCREFPLSSSICGDVLRTEAAEHINMIGGAGVRGCEAVDYPRAKRGKSFYLFCFLWQAGGS